MSDDDDEDCIEHLWRLTGFVLDLGGSTVEYRCERCGTVLLVPPGGVYPSTA